MRWNQGTGVNLKEIAEREEAELEVLAKDKKALDAEVTRRSDVKNARPDKDQLGGMGMGLLLVKAFTDSLEEGYDPLFRLKTVTFTIRRVKDGA